MGWEDYTYPPLLRYCETGSTGDLGGVAAWGPWAGGGTPNQEWMRAALMFVAGVAGARQVLFEHLWHQAEHGHQYLGTRSNGTGSWSEQDSGIYENFWLVAACAAWRRAGEVNDGDALFLLERWCGHHAARLSAVPLPASTGHPVGTPGARSSEPCMGPRSMAYHLLVAEQPEERVRYWRGDTRARELEAAVLGCSIGRVTPRLDYRLRHPVRVWRGDGWSWQTCVGLARTKPGPVATVVVGRPLPGGDVDRDAPGVLWSREAVNGPGAPHEVQGGTATSAPVKPPPLLPKPPEPPGTRPKPQPQPPKRKKPPKPKEGEPFAWVEPHAFDHLHRAQCRRCYRGKAAHPTTEPVPARAVTARGTLDRGKAPPLEWGVNGAGSPL